MLHRKTFFIPGGKGFILNADESMKYRSQKQKAHWTPTGTLGRRHNGDIDLGVSSKECQVRESNKPSTIKSYCPEKTISVNEVPTEESVSRQPNISLSTRIQMVTEHLTFSVYQDDACGGGPVMGSDARECYSELTILDDARKSQGSRFSYW